MIQLDLTEDQFKTLLKASYYASLCNTTDDHESEFVLPSEIESITDFLLQKSAEHGILSADREYAQLHGESAALEKDLDEDEEISSVYGEHCENLFWEELISHFVGRELAMKYGEDVQIDQVPIEEQDELFEKYEKHISEYGLSKVIIPL